MRLTKWLGASALAILFGFAPVIAQAGPPTATLQNYSLRYSVGAVQTLSTVGPSTVSSPAQTSALGSGLTCVYNQTAQSGSSSVTWSIQSLAPGTTATWVTLISSTAVTTNTTNMLSVGRGVATTANVGLGISLPAVWRTQVVESGASTTVTGTVGCDVAS
jgi:hypothetical protein